MEPFDAKEKGNMMDRSYVHTISRPQYGVIPNTSYSYVWVTVKGITISYPQVLCQVATNSIKMNIKNQTYTTSGGFLTIFIIAPDL